MATSMGYPVVNALHQEIFSVFHLHRERTGGREQKRVWEQGDDVEQEDRESVATTRFNAMRATVRSNHWTKTRAEFQRQIGYANMSSGYSSDWTSCKQAGDLIMLLASSKSQAPAALRFDLSAEEEQGPSLSLRETITQVREEAAPDGVIVLGIVIADGLPKNILHHFSHVDRGHHLTLILAPEIWRIYQAWIGEYSLLDWLNGNGVRIRHNAELEDFLERFDILEKPEKTWTDSLNDAYEACFDVDINGVQARRHSELPKRDIRKPSPWNPHVKIFRIVNVQMEDLSKFRWELDEK